MDLYVDANVSEEIFPPYSGLNNAEDQHQHFHRRENPTWHITQLHPTETQSRPRKEPTEAIVYVVSA